MISLHNASVGRWLAVLFICGFQLLFGIGVYYMLQNSIDVILGSTGALSVAIFVAALTVGGGVWIFAFGEYAWRDIQDYHDHNGGLGVRQWCVVIIGLLVMGMEFTALNYRMQQIPGGDGWTWLYAFGVILMLLSPLIGIVLFAMANRDRNKPLAAVVRELQVEARQRTAADMRAALRKLSATERRRFAELGDVTIIDLSIEHQEINRGRPKAAQQPKEVLAAVPPAQTAPRLPARSSSRTTTVAAPREPEPAQETEDQADDDEDHGDEIVDTEPLDSDAYNAKIVDTPGHDTEDLPAYSAPAQEAEKVGVPLAQRLAQTAQGLIETPTAENTHGPTRLRKKTKPANKPGK